MSNRHRVNKGLRSIAAAVLLMICGSFFQLCRADIRPDLVDERLQHETDWALMLDVQDINHFLNYSGSQLHPLSRVRVSFRNYPRAAEGTQPQDSRTYEQFWYYDGKPIGLRRRSEVHIAPDSTGLIVLGSTDGKPEHTQALTNALIRIVLDLQFKRATASTVLVGEQDYDLIAAALNRYHFYPITPTNGTQLVIHLSCNHAAREEFFFYTK